MYARADGIVDLGKSICIGCKACIAACPYDTVFIDPEDHSAEKCNFCAHRIDLNLEPACVVVCPTEAIMVGDLNDPNSRVAEIVGRQPVAVRPPEKETHPKLFYMGARQATLTAQKGCTRHCQSGRSPHVRWTDGSVHQNLTFPVHPDPISGMHCWHQAVRLTRAKSSDRYGDIHGDTEKSYAAYTKWLQMTRPADRVSPDSSRCPYRLQRPLEPGRDVYQLPHVDSAEPACGEL